jgi:hypothetical protein
MTTSLGDITFTDQQIQRISTNQVCEMLVFAIPFGDSDETEVYNWGGNVRRFTISGNNYQDNFTTARTLYTQLLNLFRDTTNNTAEQRTITFTFPLEPSGIKVKVESVEVWSDSSAIPNGHFAFQINLVQST